MTELGSKARTYVVGAGLALLGLGGALYLGAQASGPGLAEVPATAAFDASVPFGRHGPLTERERQMAEVAWAFFVNSYQEKTGLANAVGSYPSTTMWDTASYLSGLVSAYELGIIDKREFDSRATKIIATLRNLNLFRGELPNKVYNTETGEKVDYTNKPGEVGYSALDIGRLLIWLRIMKERYPYLAGSIDNVVLRWNFCNVIGEDGRMNGALVSGDKKVTYVQEGRLGYEEYAAKGFQLWGFSTDAASSPDPYDFVRILDVDVPVDGRDPRIFKNQNYALSEGYLLEGIELNWDLVGDRSNQPGIASDGWRADFADRIYEVQERRFATTGILTARSEHQVEGAPYFVYDAIFADGYNWNTLDPSGVFQPDRAAVATKAAMGMWALWDTPYTQLLFDYVADQYDPEKGFYEGVYENGNGAIPLASANNNGILLATLLYKVQGPLLRYQNPFTQVWDTANAGTDLRANKCHPKIISGPQPHEPLPDPGNCPAGLPPAEGQAGFRYCRPAPRPLPPEPAASLPSCTAANPACPADEATP